jgi:PAS domain S-box-containing protein
VDPHREVRLAEDDALGREELLAELQRLRARIAEIEHSPAPTVGERLFGGLLEAAPDGIVITDAAGVIRLVNPHAEQIFGYERGELTGKPIEVLIPDELRKVHVQHRKAYASSPASRRMGIGLKLVGRRKDGTEVPTEISLSPLETPEGRYTVSAIRDVTERRDAERLMQQQAEALARSNDELQQFAYVASHDLQEPLRMVSSYLQLLERRYQGKLDDDAREFIAFAVDGAKRMQALINDLLAFSRIGTRDDVHSRVDLGDTLQKVLKDLDLAIAEAGAKVHVDRLPTVTAEPTQMSQLLGNLVGNAIKFHRPGEAPEVWVSARHTGEAWEIAVKDNGIGLDPKYRDRIFQIFQRLHTRQEYPGTGIGLAICKRIVERHRGSLRVESAPGEGATFLFTLPDRRH